MGKIQILKASAGSGKTFMLAYEYVRNVVLVPESYKNILAVTFTKKATGEMKGRILDELYVLTQCGAKRDFLDKLLSDTGLSEEQVRANAQRALNGILRDYSNFSVMTIDSFFQKILRSFIKELNLNSDYAIELNTDYLLSLSIDSLLCKSVQDKELRSWIDSFMEDNLESSKRVNLKNDLLPLSFKILDEKFNKSYFEDNKEALHLFFTRVRELRDSKEELVVSPAKQFLECCQRFDIGVDMLPGKSRGIMSYIKKVAAGQLDMPSATNRALIGDGADKKWSKVPSVCAGELRTLVERIYYNLDNSIQDLNSANAILKSHQAFALLADVSIELNALCAETNKMILPNTNYLISKLVSNNDIPYIYEKVGNFYSIIMIDEFQDTSRGQWENFKPLIANAVAEVPDTETAITLVGDVKQSIYRWRGGDWRILSEDVNTYLGSDIVDEKNLAVNYRSSKVIVDFNNRMMRHCADELNTTINEFVGTSMGHNILSKAYLGMEQDLPVTAPEGGYVEMIHYSEKDNLQHLVEIVKDAQDRGYKPKDIAILTRYKKEAAAAVDALLSYKQEHPEEEGKYCFDLVSTEGLRLCNSPLVVFIINVFNLAFSEDDIKKSLYNQFLCRELHEEISEEDKVFIHSLLSLTVSEAFERVISYYKLGDDKSNLAYLQSLHAAIINFSEKDNADMTSFIDYWTSDGKKLAVSLPEGLNAINIDTIFKSKGLQYGLVIIPFCSWNLLPKTNGSMWAMPNKEGVEGENLFALPNTQEQAIILNYTKQLTDSCFSDAYIEETVMSQIENINLLYVALTRAKNELYIMMPEEKRIKGVHEIIKNFTSDSMTFGDKLIYKSKMEVGATSYFDKFHYIDSSSRVVVHTESDKFFRDMENEQSAVDERGKGIVLHSLFEKCKTPNDFPTLIDSTLAAGVISQQEAQELKEKIAEALTNPVILDWFSDKYTVISERSILLPESDASTVLHLRPDRVLINGSDAIIIDYKFGKQRSSHLKQMSRYREVLMRMGYTNISTYLWYINENSLVKS